MTARAVLFVDGSNWYHGLKEAGVDLGRLDYVKMATKLVGPRQWIALRYYVGQVKQVRQPEARSRAAVIPWQAQGRRPAY